MRFRLANIVQQINSHDDVWRIIKNVKSELFNESCNMMFGVYSDSSIASLISTIESQLNINFGNLDHYTRRSTMTKECLTEAAKMFTYLNICADEAWLTFYNDLFQTQSPDKIILTLNRIMTRSNIIISEGVNTATGIYLKKIVQNLLKRTETFLSLKYREIQGIASATVGKGINASATDDWARIGMTYIKLN